MTTSKIYVLPISPGKIIELIGKIHHSAAPAGLLVIDSTITDQNLAILGMEFNGSMQKVHLQVHPKRANMTLAFFEGDPKLAEMLEIQGLTMSSVQLQNYLSVAGADLDVLSAVTEVALSTENAEVYVEESHERSNLQQLAERIMSLPRRGRAEIDAVLGGHSDNLMGIVEQLEELTEEVVARLGSLVSKQELAQQSSKCRRLARSVGLSSDRARAIAAAALEAAIKQPVDRDYWRSADSWALLMGPMGSDDPVIELLEEIVARDSEGTLSKDWVENVARLYDIDDNSEEAPQKPSTAPADKEMKVDAISFGIGAVVGAVVTGGAIWLVKALASK